MLLDTLGIFNQRAPDVKMPRRSQGPKRGTHNSIVCRYRSYLHGRPQIP